MLVTYEWESQVVMRYQLTSVSCVGAIACFHKRDLAAPHRDLCGKNARA